MVHDIQAHSDMCWKCGTPLYQMSVVVADIDQAFEACESHACVRVLPCQILSAWSMDLGAKNEERGNDNPNAHWTKGLVEI